MVGELSTGIPALDRRLDGGLYPGDILALVAPPATQSQALLYQVMNERPTLYVSTLRPEESVQRDFDKHGGIDVSYRIETTGNNLTMEGELIHELTGSRTYTGNSAVKDDPLDDLYDFVESIERSINLIVDPANPLERGDSRDAYNETLSFLGAKLAETDSLGILLCHTSESQPPFRDLTLIAADVVWEVDVVSISKDDIEYQLRVPKNRGGTIITEDLSLDISNRTVTIDDSRAI
ncbi:RecA-superfamily ATPase implicated in signal transduction, inactivated [Halapricum desulfuricans]|uniref:RecA-superfamily ATPase implicated in signal transduction, inactivated n=1 Tax=Halapricum desulfuricans TaxID=2841257 RepID=A0A897NL11_9EURY|nr:ATPase domain-containing protein [Halapricum desulfuricans]QSG11559.1 RecA-superfamily ATPase implicated in signal transduction, inactivated [Halapricum desulfuricans]